MSPIMRGMVSKSAPKVPVNSNSQSEKLNNLYKAIADLMPMNVFASKLKESYNGFINSSGKERVKKMSAVGAVIGAATGSIYGLKSGINSRYVDSTTERAIHGAGGLLFGAIGGAVTGATWPVSVPLVLYAHRVQKMQNKGRYGDCGYD